MNIIELKHVTRSYTQGDITTQILHDINLEVASGELIAIVGPSGSGKSTLLNILGCLDVPTTGDYLVQGHNTRNMDADSLAHLRRDFFGFIFQRYNLLTHLNASENVQMPAVYAGLDENKRIEKARLLLERLGLGQRLHHLPRELSGGQQQRVSIARSLMNGGHIILADEPTGALDTKSGQDVLKILHELHAEGHTVIIVTHDMKIAHEADRVIEIKDGHIVSDKKSEVVSPHKVIEHDDINANKREIKRIEANSLAVLWSSLRSSFAMAYKAMIANRMRTLLTMLGIIIGIVAVISVVAIAKGASQQVLESISSMGTNTLTINPGKSMVDPKRFVTRTLTLHDLNAVSKLNFVDSASPTIHSKILIREGNVEGSGFATGADPMYFRVFGYEIAEGRAISEQDVLNNSQVAVIDHNVRQLFFPNRKAIGERILINKIAVTIIGVMAPPRKNDENLRVYMPYKGLMSRVVNQSYLTGIVVRVKDDYETAVAEYNLERLLLSRHGIKDFYIFSSDSIRQSIVETNSVFTLLIGAVAFISLLVGGIGVMNIMLVSVTERTKEIGIRMAAGAMQKDIMAQFLIEALMVCFIGGSLGVLISFGVGGLLQLIEAPIQMHFSLSVISIAVICSSVIGIGFGFMPARKASKLNPIEALSRE